MFLGVCLALLSVLPARAVNTASSAAGLPGALHASPLAVWPGYARSAAPSGASASPLLRALELRGHTPQSYAGLSEAQRTAAAKQAEDDVRAEAAEETRRLIEEATSADPSDPRYGLLAARLVQMAGPLAEYAPADQRASLLLLSKTLAARLSPERRAFLMRRLELMRRELEGDDDRDPALAPRETAVELEVSRFLQVPAALMTPGVARLRASFKPTVVIKPRVEGAALGVKIGLVRAGAETKNLAARQLYRRTLNLGQRFALRFGQVWRAYVSLTEPQRHPYRWNVLRSLFKKGDFGGAFGHQTYKLDPKVASKQVGNDERPRRLAAQQARLRNVTMTPSLGISGMSFPQLTAQSHLSLLYIDLKLAKDQDVRLLHNTGEGSPHLLLGLLEGDAEKMKRGIVDWAVANGVINDGGWNEARAIVMVDELMAKRDELFKDFSKEDLARAQIVAQFGGGLNGIRRDDDEERIDYDKLRVIAASPYVAMIQYKLKQAAKRGAKVDASKMEPISLSFRELSPAKKYKSPEVIAEMAGFEEIAAMVRATRAVTDKPVSLKFGIGDVPDTLELLRYLRDRNAMPDHIQIDGAGKEFSPGSGNAPPEADTSLPADQGIIAADAILKKLGVRDQVFVDVSGDILWPVDAVLKLALGADGVCAARGWLGMGVGCSMAKKCDGADGQCPWGIASAGSSLPTRSLDPAVVAPKGHRAAANWHKEYAKMLSEAGVEDAWKARSVLGLHNPLSPMRVKDENGFDRHLDHLYSRELVIDTLRGALTPEEVDRFVFGK
jgi:glutamate synthase domain-containing protein 2